MILELEKLGKEITVLGDTFTRLKTFDKHLERGIQKEEKWVKSTLNRKNYGPYKGYVCVSPTKRYYSP